MKIKDVKRFFLGLNTDDAPAFLKDGEFVDGLNVRVTGSNQQHGAGNLETLQGEIPVLFEVVADITYYGTAIGGSFVYSGYEEVLINGKVWMKKNWDFPYPGSKAYDDDEDNADVYGRLYTHDQIMMADFCPPGWHVPTEAEWDELLTYLGGLMIAGGKLKEYDIPHWLTPNTGASDIVAFTALPGGKCDAAFSLLQQYGMFWMVEDAEPTPPTTINASEVTPISFKANWLAVSGVTGYYLDVATDVNFTAFVAGFNGLDVGNVLVYPVTGLSVNTPYYIRTRAYNEVGTSANSNTITQTTKDGLVDADGNAYTYVTIGTQQWMVENFRSTKYADGTAIAELTNDGDWASDGSGAYCAYDNNPLNIPDYGLLYNWYAVDNAHGLAPAGWRVPTDTDWQNLIAFLGGENIAGGILKEIGINHWESPNLGATDEYGFSAEATGVRTNTGLFFANKNNGYWWTATDDGDGPIYYKMYSVAESIFSEPDSSFNPGCAVRMMRDTP